MFESTIERLAAAGLEMYEISNFARPGHESRHNLVYWANDAYFGFGVGAARYLRGVRSVNTRDLNAYLRRIEAGLPATGPSEELSAEARARETAILMLRRTQTGIERDDFQQRTGFDLDALAGETIERFTAQRIPRRRRTTSPAEPRGPVRRRPGLVRVSLNSTRAALLASPSSRPRRHRTRVIGTVADAQPRRS